MGGRMNERHQATSTHSAPTFFQSRCSLSSHLLPVASPKVLRGLTSWSLLLLRAWLPVFPPGSHFLSLETPLKHLPHREFSPTVFP